MADSFETLKEFLVKKMRMSHIYQPLMIKVLVERGGIATARQIAEVFLAHDESQIEYYEHITKIWPTKTLTHHGLIKRDGEKYHLTIDIRRLSDAQRTKLIYICDEKIRAYEEKRGQKIWEHRIAGLGEVSGSERYDVLKRAGFRCELCGVPADERALDVDHILPRKYGGTDDPENLQALCWKCNANKGDRDDTDFRAVRENYAIRDSGCPFCTIPRERIVMENSLAYVVRDMFPVTPNHSLIVPKRHVIDFFDVTGAESNALWTLASEVRRDIVSRDAAVSAFNVGVNVGQDAGQTVFHAHVHLIPRRKGDVENPRGGVRSILPGKADY